MGTERKEGEAGRTTRYIGATVALTAVALLLLRLAAAPLDAWLPGFAATTNLTLGGFTLAGAIIWFCRRPHPRFGCMPQRLMTVILGWFAAVMVVAHLSGSSIPHLSAFNTSLAFLFLALALWLLPRGGQFAALVSTLLIQLIVALALHGLAVLWAGFDPLLGWSGPVRMTAYTAAGFLVLALATAISRHESEPMSGAGITLISAFAVVTTSLFVVLAMGAVTTRHLIQAEGQALELLLAERARLLERTLAWRLREAETLALQLTHSESHEGSQQPALGDVLEVAKRRGDYQALLLEDSAGRTLGGFGSVPSDLVSVLPLHTLLPSALSWNDPPILMVEAPVSLPDGDNGRVRVHTTLPILGETLQELHGLGQSGEIVLCGGTVGGNLYCLPNRHRHAPFVVSAARGEDEPIPVARAFGGGRGTAFATDYRGVEVLAAYAPLADSGLAMVVKRDSAELHASFLRDLAPIPPLWLAMIVLGMVMVRIQFRPVVGALERAEWRYRNLVETSPDWIWEVDQNGRYTYASPAVLRLLGYRPAEVEGRSAFELMPADEAERNKIIFYKTAERREPFQGLEKVCLHKTGRRVVMETSGVPIFDETGNWCGYCGIDRDITLQHESLEALRRSEERFRTLVERSSDGIVLLGTDRRYLDLNEAACRMLGGRRGQLLGMRPDDLLLPEELPEMLGAVAALQHGAAVLARRRLRRLDGRVITLEVSSQGLEDGTMISLLRDVTERDRMEQALHHSEQLYRTVVEVLAEGVVVQDNSGKIIALNRAAAMILGRTEEDIRERDLLDPAWSVIHEDGTPFPGGSHPAMLTLRNGEPQREVIMGVMRPDGTRVWISVNSELLRDEADGEVHGVVTSFQDISLQREATRALRDSRQRLRALTAHLQEVREKEKAELARELHDELGGTLTALKIDAVWLLQALPPDSPLHSKLDGMAALVDGAVGAVRRIVTELRPTLLDDLGLWAALEWLVRQFEQRTEVQSRLHIECEQIEPTPEQSLALFRVVQEALTNISRHAEASWVKVDCWHDGTTLHMSIEDNGVGMDSSVALDPTSHGVRSMYERLGELGGRIDFHSSVGDGTMLFIHLPLSTGALE